MIRLYLPKPIGKSLLFTALLVLAGLSLRAQATTAEDRRAVWLDYLDRVARPVLENLAEDRLRETMPVVLSPKIDQPESRTRVAYLEAFGRTLCGIAPWLELEGGSAEEIALRQQYREWTLRAIANAVDNSSNDYMEWRGGQPLVDASFFALGLVRSPWLWEHLDATVQEQVVAALRLTRPTMPVYSNWLLFSGMIEAFFCQYGYPYDRLRLEFGIREFSQHWYTGDGMFSDGNHFALDYYNSYVIQPYLIDILDAVSERDRAFAWFEEDMHRIAARYAEIQERSINQDGTFPVLGRSIVYRSGAFHHLANTALRRQLPASISPAQVRGALTAVVQQTLGAPNTFTPDGWLRLGLHGHQPGLADFYINTGSLYLCAAVFLPLGLPAEDPFWAEPDAPWTAKKVWSGIDVPADHRFHRER